MDTKAIRGRFYLTSSKLNPQGCSLGTRELCYYLHRQIVMIVTSHGLEIGPIYWGAAGGILRLAPLIEGALLLCRVVQRPLPVDFSVNWCQDLVNSMPQYVAAQLFFRIPGRSFSFVAWAAPDRIT